MNNLIQRSASVQFESDEYYISPICDFARSIMRDYLEEHLTFAVSMILANAIQTRIKNGFPEKKGSMTLDISVNSCDISIILKDKGLPSNPDLTFNAEDIFKSQKDFNNMLLHTFLDSVEIRRLGKDGQSICMKLNILERRQNTFVAPEAVAAAPLDTNIMIRRIETKDDALAVIKCLYEAYGYSYIYEKMYYDDSVLELNSSDRIKVFILKNDHDQTAGTFTLKLATQYLDMAEIGTLIVCKEFRNLHLARDMMERGVEEARMAGCSAVMGQPVTYHTATQKLCISLGMAPTAILFEYIDSEMETEYSKEKKRYDACCCVRIFNTTEKRSLYPPKRILNVTERVYKELGASYEIMPDEEIEDFTLSSVETNHRMLFTKINVTQIGKNFEQFLSQCVNSAIVNKHEMIELSLNMFYPGCDHAFEIARKKGFAFSGFIPGSALGDYIIMQMLPGKEINYKDAVLTDGFVELLEEIKQINEWTE